MVSHINCRKGNLEFNHGAGEDYIRLDAAEGTDRCQRLTQLQTSTNNTPALVLRHRLLPVLDHILLQMYLIGETWLQDIEWVHNLA